MNPLKNYFKLPLIYRVGAAFVLGIVLGVVLSLCKDASWVGTTVKVLSPFGTVLVSMLKMIVFPIIFFSLVMGAANLPLKKFGSWLFTIAHNKCMDYFKTNHSDRFADITEMEIRDSGTPFDRQIIDSIVMEEALSKLTPPQREVVILHFIHRFTAKQISRMTKTPLPTIKSRIAVSRKRLKELLGEDRYE